MSTTDKNSVWRRCMTALRYLIPLAVTVGLCYVLFRDIDLQAMWSEMCASDYRWIAIGFIPATLACLFRALRWRLQLRAVGIRPTLWQLTLSFFGTYAVNIVFPRLGEIWRTEYIARRQNAKFSIVFGSMVSDRLADTLTVLLITVMTALFTGPYLSRFIAQYPAAYNMLHALLTSPWTYVTAVAACALLWWLLRRSRDTGGPGGRILRVIRGLWDGFAAIGRMQGKWQWLGWTVLLWLSYFAQMWLAFRATPLTRGVLEHDGIVAVVVCYVLTTISMGVPSNGGIGPYQTVLRFGLWLFAGATVAHDIFDLQALAFANLLLGSNTLLFILLGIMTFIVIGRQNAKENKSVKQ